VKTVLVTGSDGMLGSEVIRQLRKLSSVNIVPATVKTMDITNLSSIRAMFERYRPTHVLHCAAFTAVDTAEKEPLNAFMVNAEGTKNLAFFASRFDTEILYISTDYVFDGKRGKPYTESDVPHPLNTYGVSKLRGEEYLRELLERHKIIRTSWLNGLGGVYNRNFIETMLRISEQRNELAVVDDQTGRPTFTFDLAKALILLLDAKSYGVFHVTGEGNTTWFGFARKIFELAEKQVQVKPITTEQFRSLAERPRYSVLKNTRFEALGMELLPHWEDSLKEYLRRRTLAQSISDSNQKAPSKDATMAPAAE
jgi:dTDP-4-dehydrorhamnose reductase